MASAWKSTIWISLSSFLTISSNASNGVLLDFDKTEQFALYKTFNDHNIDFNEDIYKIYADGTTESEFAGGPYLGVSYNYVIDDLVTPL